MPHNRYYSQEILTRDHIVIRGAENTHLSRVMRKSIGDVVEIIDGQGHLGIGTITKQTVDSSEIYLDKIQKEDLPTRKIILILAILRPQHLDFAIEKTVELGVDSIWLYPADRSEKKKLTDQQLHRLNSLCISSVKQCGRLYMPHIFPKKSLEECLRNASDGPVYYGNPRAVTLTAYAHKGSTYLCIGPESGFSEKEEITLQSLAKPFRLHKNILRAETAAIAAVCYFTIEQT